MSLRGSKGFKVFIRRAKAELAKAMNETQCHDCFLRFSECYHTQIHIYRQYTHLRIICINMNIKLKLLRTQFTIEAHYEATIVPILAVRGTTPNKLLSSDL